MSLFNISGNWAIFGIGLALSASFYLMWRYRECFFGGRDEDDDQDDEKSDPCYDLSFKIDAERIAKLQPYEQEHEMAPVDIV